MRPGRANSISASLRFPRYGDEANSPSFDEYLVELQKSRDMGFFNQEQVPRWICRATWPWPSHYTRNIVGYWERPESDIRIYALVWSSIRGDVDPPADRPRKARPGLDKLPLPIDQLATRVNSPNREAAILDARP